MGSLLRRSKTESKKQGATDAEAETASGANALGVLVVNDDEDACELLCRVLQHSGAVAFRAHSGDGALDELRAHRASVHAVVLDFSSGTATSFSVLESIRADGDLAELSVMIVATTDANRTLAYEAGVDEFVTRPFHVDEFTSAVGAMLARTADERVQHRLEQVAGVEAD